MNQPTIRFRPLKRAVAGDKSSILDLLITISPQPPSIETNKSQRTPLNLALVIDRSGSMSGSKLSNARKAARFLASELTERDRLAIISFDEGTKVVIPSQAVRDPQPFLAAINTIHSGGLTALFDGWMAGAIQVAENLDPTALNRVLLLSDGHANQGITNQKKITEKVEGLSERGVSTSAFGLGQDFDEDLMGAIATAGDGTLAHIESPRQLADLYASELESLTTTVGRKVSFGLRGKDGVQLIDLLNDLPPTKRSNYRLPSLRLGQELNIGVRLDIPAWSPNKEICSIRLAWDSPGESQRNTLIEHLNLPVRSKAEIKGMDADETVIEEFAVLEANRARRKAMEELDRNDFYAAHNTLKNMSLSMSLLSPSLRKTREIDLIEKKLVLLRKNRTKARKDLSRESFRSSLDVWEEKNHG